MGKFTKEEIENLLLVQKLGKYETAKRLGTTYQTLTKCMDEYGIKIPEKYNTEEIIKLYVDDKLNAKEIERKIGAKSNCIIRLLRKNGIEIRHDGNSSSFKKNQVPWNKKDIDEKDYDEIAKMYINCVPLSEIAAKFNVSFKAIERFAEKENLKRSRSMKSRDLYDDTNDEKIVSLYNEGKSSTEIAKIFGVGHRTILAHLKRCGVKRRTLSESQFNSKGKVRPKDFDSYEKMYDLYIVNNMSKKEIADIYDTDGGTIDNALKKLGIKVRTPSESMVGRFSGEKHPNWKGGRSGLYMRLREYFRFYQAREVLKRDKRTCQMCGGKKHLQVHHIKPFKEIFDEIMSEHPDLDIQKDQEALFEIMKNDKRINDLDNLITYCKECHLFKVHGYKKKEIDIKNA